MRRCLILSVYLFIDLALFVKATKLTRPVTSISLSNNNPPSLENEKAQSKGKKGDVKKMKSQTGRPNADLTKPLTMTEFEKKIIGKRIGSNEMITEEDIRLYRMRRSEINRRNYERRKMKWDGNPSKKRKDLVLSTKLVNQGKGSLKDIQIVLENRERLRLLSDTSKQRKDATTNNRER